MTKNKKTILLTLLACFVLFIAADIGGVRLRFGTAYINDSTAYTASLNKGLVVHGTLKSTDSLTVSGNLFLDDNTYIYWNGLTEDPNILGNGGDISITADELDHFTIYGTNLLNVDSINGVLEYLPGYSNKGRGLVKTKVIQSTLGGTTPGNFLNIAHGISPITKIIDWDMKVYEDSIGTWLPINYGRTSTLTVSSTIEINGTNCSWFIPASAGNLKNAGDTVRFTIRYLGN